MMFSKSAKVLTESHNTVSNSSRLVGLTGLYRLTRLTRLTKVSELNDLSCSGLPRGVREIRGVEA